MIVIKYCINIPSDFKNIMYGNESPTSSVIECVHLYNYFLTSSQRRHATFNTMAEENNCIL